MKAIFKRELTDWLTAVYYWSSKKLLFLGRSFENIKGFVVKRLLWRRGALNKPFLNTSFGIFLSIGVVIAPIIANSYPTLGVENRLGTETASSVINTQTASTVETTTKESEKPRDKIISHEVLGGETLSKIAEKYGISVETIEWQNNLTDANDLTVGQKLEILPVTGVSHTISAGETIYSIANKYKLANAQPIVDFPFNTFRDDETFALNIGDEIIVPGGIKIIEENTAPSYEPTYLAHVPQYTGTSGGLFVWPAYGDITQDRSWYHTGIDIANGGASNVVAAAGGRVISTIVQGWGYGWHVIVDNGDYQTLYAHLQRIDVSEGQDVAQGQVIGEMGSTGRSTGTHLHFEIRRGGEILSPRDFLK